MYPYGPRYSDNLLDPIVLDWNQFHSVELISSLCAAFADIDVKSWLGGPNSRNQLIDNLLASLLGRRSDLFQLRIGLFLR